MLQYQPQEVVPYGSWSASKTWPSVKERSLAREGICVRKGFARTVASNLLALIPLCLVSCHPGEKGSSKPLSRSSDEEAPAKSLSRSSDEEVVEPDYPVSFGYKCAWLAIRTQDPETVVASLGLTGVRKSGWKQGIEAAYKGAVFVTPATKGWVLVVSFSLPEIADKTREDRLSPLIKTLGKEFSDVQYFGTHRVVEYHGWARVVKGKIVRQYAYLGERGETLCNEGKPTEEETKLGLIYDESKFPEEEDVMELAGAWSINPTTLEELKSEKGVGFLGSLPKK